MFKKSIKIISILLLLVSSIYCIIFVDTNIKIHLRTILIIIPEILILLSIFFKFKNYNILKKLTLTLFIIVTVCMIVYTILYKMNVLSKISSVQGLKNYILSTGGMGIFIYISIQALQVVFLPIPASIICIVGSLIYGPFLGGLYCSVGVLIGSFISFFIGRIFGYKLVSWIVGTDNTNKYSETIRTRGIFFLGLAFLLPMFPDDILCFIAGITNIPIKKFLIVTLITRPIGVIFMAIFGGGYVIPFTGWGIYAWIGILIVAIAFVIILCKWQEQIQDIILNKIFRRKTRKNES